MNNIFSDKETFKEALKTELSFRYGRDFENAYPEERYLALGSLIRNQLGNSWKVTKKNVKNQNVKQLYYFSMEFLMGRLMVNNLMNMGIYDVVRDGLADLGMDLHNLEMLEEDAGLGNGGLGRLAACFLDSLASLNLAGNGNCIRYRYGLFKQEIVNDQQVEKPDCWLKLGNVWEVWKPQHAVQVRFGGSLNAYMDQLANSIPPIIRISWSRLFLMMCQSSATIHRPPIPCVCGMRRWMRNSFRPATWANISTMSAR